MRLSINLWGRFYLLFFLVRFYYNISSAAPSDTHHETVHGGHATPKDSYSVLKIHLN